MCSCRCLPSWCTFTCVSVSLFLLYCAFLSKTLVEVMLPGGLFGYDLAPGPDGAAVRTLDPHWADGQALEVWVWLSDDRSAASLSRNAVAKLPQLVPADLSLGADALALRGPEDAAEAAAARQARMRSAKQTKSKKKRMRPPQQAVLLWHSDAPTYGWSETSTVKMGVNLTEANLPQPLWDAAIAGKSLYVHAVVSHRGVPAGRDRSRDKMLEVRATTRTTKMTTQKAVKPAWRLFPSMCDVCGDPNTPVAPPDASAGELVTAARDAPPSPHWKPRAAFRLVADFTRFPRDQVPPLMLRHLRVNRQGRYAPFSFADEVGLTTDKLIPLNDTLRVLPLELELSPSSLARWQLGALMEQSIELMQSGMGAEGKDTDEIRYMLTETSPTVLLLTLVVSLLHTLFDVLAFKSDIQFWRKLKTLRGLSTRAVVTSLVCHAFVVAYLHHQETSKLVLVPAAFGVLLQAWKAWKVVWGNLSFRDLASTVVGSAVNGGSGGGGGDGNNDGADAVRGVSAASEAREIQQTQYYDRVAGTYLGQVLYPVVVGSAIYSLFCAGHSGWYDWFISSAVGAVYTFGFIAMTPQLFINYKLRSVAHLPWRFLVFRALNTFIDDMFAFIIRMPTMHRLSCFRDDLVFFIYMYQRWCYPVDASRQSVGVEDEVAGEAAAATSAPSETTPVEMLRVQGAEKNADDDEQEHSQQPPAESSVPASDAKDASRLNEMVVEVMRTGREIATVFERGIREYTAYYGKRHLKVPPPELAQADKTFAEAAKLAAHALARSSLLADDNGATTSLPVSRESLEKGRINLKKLRGRSLACRMQTADALGFTSDAVLYAREASGIFAEIGDEKRLYECLNNSVLPLLEMWGEGKRAGDVAVLDLAIDATATMIALLEGPSARELNNSLGEQRHTRAQKIAKHMEMQANLQRVKRGQVEVEMIRGSGMHREITFKVKGAGGVAVSTPPSLVRRRGEGK